VTVNLEYINQYIRDFASLIENKKVNQFEGELKVGVDLGTANIVLTVLDESNQPVAGALYPASVVKDGLVVDYVGAVKIVKDLKTQVEDLLGVPLLYAATAVPPGTMGGNAKAIANVIESAGLEVVNVIDEPTAAATFLGVLDGAVVDVGGGTTGISILRNGEVIYTADEPTGGTHMSLVVAGNYKVSFEEAEKLKKDTSRQDEIFTVVKPVIEKMAAIVNRHLRYSSTDKIYVVGGACLFEDFVSVFLKEIGIDTIKPENPLFITPIGIAMNCVK
jgi:ethanolamine utilization protein EutJ